MNKDNLDDIIKYNNGESYIYSSTSDFIFISLDTPIENDMNHFIKVELEFSVYTSGRFFNFYNIYHDFSSGEAFVHNKNSHHTLGYYNKYSGYHLTISYTSVEPPDYISSSVASNLDNRTKFIIEYRYRSVITYIFQNGTLYNTHTHKNTSDFVYFTTLQGFLFGGYESNRSLANLYSLSATLEKV